MRVISGKFGSRPLKTSRGDHTRPTSDKVKESLFNWLTPKLTSNSVVLDYYGGSGALAIESISRGASHAVICEYDRQALKAIESNIKLTQADDQFTVLRGKNERAIKQYQQRFPETSFDLVFLDPPYHLDVIESDILTLQNLNLIHDDTWIVCETDANHSLPTHIGSYQLVKERRYGQTHVWLYQKELI